MDVREKLVEILKQAPFEGKVLDEWWWEEKIVRIVEHLIAHGVTVQDNTEISDELLEQLRNAPVTILQEEPTIEAVQEWISVEDRLPEPFVSVLVQMPGEEPFPTVREGFISNDGIWQCAMFRREPGEVTHWQPMPQPPKGE